MSGGITWGEEEMKCWSKKPDAHLQTIHVNLNNYLTVFPLLQVTVLSTSPSSSSSTIILSLKICRSSVLFCYVTKMASVVGEESPLVSHSTF